MKTSTRHLLGAASLTAAILLSSALLAPATPLTPAAVVTSGPTAPSSQGGEDDRPASRGRESLRLRLTLPYVGFGSAGSGGEL